MPILSESPQPAQKPDPEPTPAGPVAPAQPDFAERHDDPDQAEELERQQDA